MYRILCFFLSTMLFSFMITGIAVAQDGKPKKVKRAYCKCTINGLPRGKAFSIKYEYRPNFKMSTTDKTGTYGDSKGQIKNNGRLEVKLKIPVINKPYLSIIAGFKYNKEEYNFENISNQSNPLYKSLEDRALRSIGANITVLKPMRSNKFWVLRVNANLNGDYGSKNVKTSSYLKFSVSPALAWRKNDDLSYAVGITYSNSFGRSLVFPTVALNYNLNDRWNIESILPLFLKFRYGFNENFYWYNNIEIDGASYRLNNTDTMLSHYHSLHLHRSEVKVSSSIEKQLVGWLWAGFEVGGVHNFSYNLTNSASGSSNIIFKNKIRDRFLISASIFLVPPKRLYRKVTENL